MAQLTTRVKIAVLVGRANKLSLAGDNAAALPLYERAAALARRDDPDSWLLANGLLAETYAELDRHRDAARLWRTIVDTIDDEQLYRSGADGMKGSELRVEALGSLVETLAAADDRVAELSALAELAAAALVVGDTDERSRAFRRTAELQRRAGRSHDALATLDTAIAEAVRLADVKGEARARRDAAQLEGRLPDGGRTQTAAHHARRALDLFERLGDRLAMAECWGELGRLHRWNHAYGEARRAFDTAEDLLRTSGHDEGAAIARAEAQSLPDERSAGTGATT